MNLHKLKELEESPLRENRAQYLKRVGVHPWDYEDKKCRYHRRDYGQAHKFAEKMFEKNIGKDSKELRNKLKNDPRYKHKYFFRKGIDCAIKDMLANAFYYRWYRSDYYVDKKTNVLCKREIPVRKRRAPRLRTYYEYVDGTVIEVRNGIHYFRLSSGYYTERWNKVKREFESVEVKPVYWQLNKAWLKFYQLKNE